MRRTTVLARLLAVLLALILVAAACGSDDDDGDDSGSASEETEAAEDEAADDEAAEDEATDDEATDDEAADEEMADEEMADDSTAVALDRVEAFREPQGELAITEQLAELPTGKKVVYVQCGVVVCEEIRIGIAGAAEELGMDLEVFNHEDTPETVAAAFQNAVDSNPDVVLTSGNPREWFADQLAALEAAAVPVIAWSIPEGFDDGGGGITVNLLTIDDYHFYGTLLADYAIEQSGGEGTIIFFGLPAFPVLGELETGFFEEMDRACPDCTIENVSVDLAALGAGELPAQVVSTIQANPDASHMTFAFGGMLFGVAEAMADAGLDVGAASQAGGTLNFTLIADGNIQLAEMGLASEFLGWRAMDAAARAVAGQDIERAPTPELAELEGHPDILTGGLPLQVLEQDDMGFLETDPNGLWPGVENFKELFAELWGT